MQPKWRAHTLAFKAKLAPVDPFTKLWLCNPALGLAGPERFPEQPEGSPELPVEGPITGPSSDKGFPVLGFGIAQRDQFRAPPSRLLLYSTAKLSAKPITDIPFKSAGDLAASYPLRLQA